MKKLNFYAVSQIDELAKPNEKQHVTLDSQALDFFTDFNQTKPLVIEASTSAVDAKMMMLKSHVRLKLVIDSKDEFIGVISVDELVDLTIVQKISEGIKREDISVTDLMRSKEDLVALDINEVTRATIGDVIDVLKDSGQQHCLVMDRDTHRIRGIFSASDISRKLHLPIDIQDRSSFYKVFSATS